MAKKPIRFPEVSALRLPEGSLAKIDAIAAAKGMKRGDWLRAWVRSGILYDDVRERRRSAVAKFLAERDTSVPETVAVED